MLNIFQNAEIKLETKVHTKLRLLLSVLPGDVEDEGEEDGGQHVEGDEAGLADPRHPVLVQVRAAHRLGEQMLKL